MSLKREIGKEIEALKAEIEALETKRSRSQAALIESFISQKQPDETEMKYFRAYSAEISERRTRLTELIKQLEKLA